MKVNGFNSQGFGFIKPLSEDASTKEVYVHEQLLKHKRWQTAVEIDWKLSKEHESQLKVLVKVDQQIREIAMSAVSHT